MTNLNDLLKEYQNTFYLTGRLFAICFFGPYLIYAGNKIKNNTLLLLGVLLFLWVFIKLLIQVRHGDLYDKKRSRLYILYFIIRVFALFIVGPYLIHVGSKANNNILVFLGVYIMVWDGVKIGVQMYYNDYSY
jgi:hypothetical protein